MAQISLADTEYRFSGTDGRMAVYRAGEDKFADRCVRKVSRIITHDLERGERLFTLTFDFKRCEARVDDDIRKGIERQLAMITEHGDRAEGIIPLSSCLKTATHLIDHLGYILRGPGLCPFSDERGHELRHARQVRRVRLCPRLDDKPQRDNRK